MSITVIVADDQGLIRTGLKTILDAQPDIEVIGEATNGREAVALARELHPDVGLFDIPHARNGRPRSYPCARRPRCR